MHHALTTLPKSSVRIEITLSFLEFEPHLKQAAAVIAREIDIEGFRKGMAPYDIIKQRVGESAIYEQAAELAVRSTWKAALSEIAETKPFVTHPLIGSPEMSVTKLAPGNEFRYAVECARVPQVNLPDYKMIAERARGAPTRETSVSEQEVDKTLRWIQESRTELIAVERTAALGDAVKIDFEARDPDARIERGSARNHEFILGKARFIPGFEDELVGMAPGEEKTFTLVVPSDWRDAPSQAHGPLAGNESPAGKTLDFAVLMRSVKERKIPELTDDFAKTLGNFEHKEHLIKSVREGLAQEKQEKEKQRVRTMMLDEIAQGTKIDPPDILIDSELEKMLAELKAGTEAMGMQWDEYLAHIKKTPETLKGEWKDEALRRVRQALCLREIALRERIEPTEEEITRAEDQYLMRYGSPDEAKKTMDPQTLRDYVSGTVRNEKVFEFLEKTE